MALVAQGLKITHVQRSTALVDGDDMVDHLRGGEDALSLALLAERILLQLERAEATPLTALVEVGIVMGVAGEGFPLREPRSACMFLDAGHGGLFLFENARTARLVPGLDSNHLKDLRMGEALPKGLVVHIIVQEVGGEAGMAEALHVLKERIQILLFPEDDIAVSVHIDNVPAVFQGKNHSFRIVIHGSSYFLRLSPEKRTVRHRCESLSRVRSP